jgi:hypothetical protein
MSVAFRPFVFLRSLWIPREEVRAEIWALGGRHGGRVMEGARLEYRAQGITVRRAILLKAVIRRHSGSAAALAEAAQVRGQI